MPQTSGVSNTKSVAKREAPRWLLVVMAVVGVTCLAYFGWQALTGRDGEPGPRMKVHPGMYDLRAEAAKMRAAQPMGSTPNGR